MKFYCDVTLGKLCRWLRMAGYDCKHAGESLSDAQVLQESGARILLTRDKSLARSAPNAYYVKARDPAEQFKEVAEKFSLEPEFPEKSRCPECNARLKEVGSRPPGVPEKVRSQRFWACPRCGKVYWQGRHWNGIKNVLEVKENAPDKSGKKEENS